MKGELLSKIIVAEVVVVLEGLSLKVVVVLEGLSLKIVISCQVLLLVRVSVCLLVSVIIFSFNFTAECEGGTFVKDHSSRGRCSVSD